MLNPDVDKFVDALVDLCIGVQVGNDVPTKGRITFVSFIIVPTF